MALTSWPARIHPPVAAHPIDRGIDAALHGLDRLVEREPALQVLLGRPAQLAVDDAVGGEVFDELARHSGEALGGLHDGDGDVEGLQVLDKRTGIGLLGEPGGQLGCRGGREFDAQRFGELDDRLRPKTAVEVIVQRDLRQRSARSRRRREG